MGGNGKHRWKFSVFKSSSKKLPPAEFVCPISGSLIFDPVVVSSGHTFDRTSVQVCRDLSFTPAIPDSQKVDFSNVIPNLSLKSTILNWCDTSGADRPRPPDYYSVEKTVRELLESSQGEVSRIRDSERELLRGVAEKPQVLFNRAATELNPRPNYFYSSSSEESVIANVPETPFHAFTTRPLCYSSSSSTSSSSEIVPDENLTPGSAEEEEFVRNFKSLEVFHQEQAVISLRKLTRTNEEIRVSLCTLRLLAALKPLLDSRYAGVQTNAAASLVNLSLEKVNRVKIVRSGVVPLLINLLKGGFNESQEHAAGALFSLAIEDDNKTAIGVLGALQPLIHSLRSESERTRHDSALALYHLSLTQSNRVKLVKLGAVPTLLTLLRSGDLAGKALLVLCNMAACGEGQSAMLDASAVECLVEILRRGRREAVPESTRENCVAALYSLSHGSLRFKGLARAAKAAEVLREVEERGSERAREKAKRILLTLRCRDEEEDWDGILESGLTS